MYYAIILTLSVRRQGEHNELLAQVTKRAQLLVLLNNTLDGIGVYKDIYRRRIDTQYRYPLITLALTLSGMLIKNVFCGGSAQ